MSYRCIASSTEGLVQQVTVSYLRHGYWWYVSGRIPRRKDAEKVDRKLIGKCGIDISERQRAARKAKGLATMPYIRHENWFLLLATEGHHLFFGRSLIQLTNSWYNPKLQSFNRVCVSGCARF